MPWVVAWMALTASLGLLALIAGDRRRALGLGAVLCALPATFWLYNAADHGALWAGMLWVTFPVIVLWQGLNLRLPAILGELVGFPFIAYSFGWAPEWPAQAAADVLGLAMVAALGGPPCVKLAGMVADWARRLGRGGDLAAGAARDREGA